MADLIIEEIFNQSIFTWESNAELTKKGKAREEYLVAIKAADAQNIEPLLRFGANKVWSGLNVGTLGRIVETKKHLTFTLSA